MSTKKGDPIKGKVEKMIELNSKLMMQHEKEKINFSEAKEQMKTTINHLQDKIEELLENQKGDKLEIAQLKFNLNEHKKFLKSNFPET